MAPSQKVLLPLIAALPYASAWGSLGHTTVAYIAQNFVSDKTAKYAQTVLNDTSSNYLASIATWADSYRSTKEGAFSGVLHYIDALDNPPQSCDVIYERDCPEEGCIISAIANYSSRAVDKNVGMVEMQKALKWVVHFVGDVHQPLHVENIAVGGNQINVTFNGRKTNLHSIWDTSIPELRIGAFSLENSKKWATSLTQSIKAGRYRSQSAGWLGGIDSQHPINTSMIWARDANAYVCSAVIPDGPDAVLGKELSGVYYNASFPVVESQIAKAGYRLAAWLDAIVETAAKGPVAKPGFPLGYPSPPVGPPVSPPARPPNAGPVHGLLSPPAPSPRAPPYTIREFKLEPWMVEARAARRSFGDGCGCVSEEHAH